jgi:hypothetical protein
MNVTLRRSLETESFRNKRKRFVLLLGPFRGPFFHQGLEWFLFGLLLTILAFTHVSCSLCLDLIGCAQSNALPIDLCRFKHPGVQILFPMVSLFQLSSDLAIAMVSQAPRSPRSPR